MFTAGKLVYKWEGLGLNIQETSSDNQSSLNTASEDTLHLTEIIIRRPFYTV